jgi:hypothetical protein
MRMKKWPLMILFLSFITFLFYKVISPISSTSEFQHYSRVDCWIESSKCTLLTNTILTSCDEPLGPLKGIESVSIADDRGHTIISNLFALVFREPITKLHLLIFNLLLNILGFSLVFFYIYQKSMISSLAFLGIIFFSNSLSSYPSPDVTYAFPGLTLLSIWISLLLQENFKQKPLKYLILSTSLFFIGSLFRESIFFATAIGIIAYNSYFFLKEKSFHSFKLICVGILLFSSSKLSNSTVLLLRDQVWRTERSALVKGHGISHNLFIGLGTEKNSWGITWNDSEALPFARQANPEVKYGSDEYFKILMAKYIEFISENPLEAGKIYTIKSIKALKFLIKSFTFFHFIVLTLVVVSLGLLRKKVHQQFFLLLFLTAAHLIPPTLTVITFTFLQSALICLNTSLSSLLFSFQAKDLIEAKEHLNKALSDRWPKDRR